MAWAERARAEAQWRDRLSFRRFAGLSLSDATPDHSTLRRLRDELTRKRLIERVFAEINRQFDAHNLILKRGTLVEASFLRARGRPPSAPKTGLLASSRRQRSTAASRS